TDGDGSHGSTSKTPSYTKSVSWQHHPFSGRIMYHLASKFYVQNESLLQLYPKAIFSGRL
ncbi:UDP-N-acetylglucosamine transferase subunit ALG14, partial [Enterobacter hormaechei]|nr:UDP-N-acetylglucosamine transferase subunit ALG14 [Enterobacter hormaechei]